MGEFGLAVHSNSKRLVAMGTRGRRFDIYGYKIFISVILLPIIGNAAEHYTAIVVRLSSPRGATLKLKVILAPDFSLVFRDFARSIPLVRPGPLVDPQIGVLSWLFLLLHRVSYFSPDISWTSSLTLLFGWIGTVATTCTTTLTSRGQILRR